MMKKFLLTVLTATVLFAVSSCGKEPEDPGEGPPQFVPYIVSFSINHGDTSNEVTYPDPVQRTITEDKNTVDLPTEPTRPYFEFVEWNTKADGTGEEFTADTPVTASMVNSGTNRVIVYAKWKFLGGAVKVDGDTLVHNYPTLEISNVSAHGSFLGSINDDGSVTIARGAFRYKFPTTGKDSNDADYNIADYTYFKIDYELSGITVAGNGTGCKVTPYNSDGNYSDIKNVYPWWSNNDNSTQEFPISGAGTSGGIAFRFNGKAATAEENFPYTISILSITFYKVNSLTVSFNLDGGTADGGGSTIPEKSVRENSSLGDAMPADPTKAGFFFIGWFDGANLVTSVTVITKNTSLKAKWTDTEPDKVEQINNPNESSGVPIYRFTMPGTKTWADIKAMTFTAMVLDETTYNLTGIGRVHIVGNYAATDNFNTTTGALAVPDWSDNRIVIHENNQNIADILNRANESSGENLRGKWVTFTIPLGSNINTRWKNPPAENSSKPPAKTPLDTDTGPFLLGVGLTGNNTRGLPAYYQKDVALILDDDTVVSPDSFDEFLTGDAGLKLGQLFFTANGSYIVTRTMVYEPEEL
jgi:uncharacterized repeat protein (TIGR02543 family)